MTFGQIQDAVISNRFDPNQRSFVKDWINYRYARLWGAENWSFKYQINTYNVLSGATSLPKAGIGDILRVWDTSIQPSYLPMTGSRAEDMWDEGSQTTAGRPYDYTVIGSTIYFERPFDQNRSLQILSSLPFTSLVNDSDLPLIPTEFHYMLVAGATATGLMRENDPAYQAFEGDWNNAIEALRGAYLTSLRTSHDIYPGWP